MAKKTKSQIGADRVKWETQTRFNPIQNLTPLSLSAHLDAWERGDIKNLARVWDVMARRDLRLSGIIPKRLKAPSRRKWSIGYVGAKTPAAEKQKEIVEYALRNATLKRADDGDVQEKFSGVIRSMMNAVAFKYATHEIVWKPTPSGITFDAIYVPLWFFERHESKLRYLESPYSPDGIDLKPGEWLTMVGDGLMEPSSIAYMFKSLPLKDWLAFTDKFGVPGVVVKTDATPGSTEWDQVNLAVESYGTDMALVVSRSGTEFDFPGAKVGDGGAMQNLVEYCDRAMAVIWRGGDLSTMSQKGDSNGSMMQMEERATLEADDCERVEATINQQLLPWIVKFGTGDDDVLVEFKIDVSDLSDTDQSLNIDRTLHNMGLAQSKEDMATRYGRNLPDDGDDVLKTPQEIAEESRSDRTGGNAPHVAGIESEESKEARRRQAEEEILANETESQVVTVSDVAQVEQAQTIKPTPTVFEAFLDWVNRVRGFVEKPDDDKYLANDRFEEMAVETSVDAVRSDFEGIAQLIAEAMEINDAALQRARLAQIVENMDVPVSPELEAIIERAMKAALVNGFGEMASGTTAE